MNSIGKVTRFDQKTNYEDALGQVREDIGSLLLTDVADIVEAERTIDGLEDGEELDLDVGDRTYFLREVAPVVDDFPKLTEGQSESHHL